MLGASPELKLGASFALRSTSKMTAVDHPNCSTPFISCLDHSRRGVAEGEPADPGLTAMTSLVVNAGSLIIKFQLRPLSGDRIDLIHDGKKLVSIH